jgi:quinol monooxygenase YgiN
VQPLVLLVEFLVKPAFARRFGELILANAQTSLRDERGCRQFDILVSAEESHRFVLYEIYDDESAFEFHVRSQHYRMFSEAIEGEIEEQTIRRLSFFSKPAQVLASP